MFEEKSIKYFEIHFTNNNNYYIIIIVQREQTLIEERILRIIK